MIVLHEKEILVAVHVYINKYKLYVARNVEGAEMPLCRDCLKQDFLLPIISGLYMEDYYLGYSAGVNSHR